LQIEKFVSYKDPRNAAYRPRYTDYALEWVLEQASIGGSVAA